jgi:hypothetical protein
MRTIVNDILEMLHSDLVSHGWIAQCIAESNNNSGLAPESVLSDVLDELLATGIVEIGETNLNAANYVQFLAWSGTVAERISRARTEVAVAVDADKEFAYWLCLRENVDRFDAE